MSAGATDAGWYSLKRGAAAGQQSGPFTWAELYAQARQGALAPDDLVWHPQWPQWTAAAQIPGLLEVPPAVPPGPPPLPGLAGSRTPPPLPGHAGSRTPPPLPAQAAPRTPPPLPRRRPSWLLPVLIPLIALVVVGAGLGTYFGAFYRHGGASSAVRSTTVTSATGTSTGDTKATAPQAEVATFKLPSDSAITKTVYGQVPANQVNVILADGKTRADADALAKTLGGSVVGELDPIDCYQIETSGATEADLQGALDTAKATPGVEVTFPSQQVVSKSEIWGVRQSPLNDPVYSDGKGAGYGLIGVEKAWSYMRGSGLETNNVQVGIVDSGLYKGTGEFNGSGANVVLSNDAAEQFSPRKGEDGQPDPTGSHGTMVASLIGADANNGGIAGVASNLGPKLTINMLNDEGPPYAADTPTNPDPNDVTQATGHNGTFVISDLAALLKQVDSGSRVINCSFGAPTPGPQNALVAAAYRKFFEKMEADHPDVTFVCAAGNEHSELTTTNYWPAGAGSGLSNVITVGNVVNSGDRWKNSNTGGTDGEVTLAAPGHQAVQGVYPDGTVVNEYGGTSAATPQVTAAAALLLSLDPTLTAARIKEILSSTARPGPAELGGKILAVDQAVLQVINEVRQKNGLEPVTAEDLENAGVIDAVAVSQGSPNSYMIEGVVKGIVPPGGFSLEVTNTEGATLNDESTHQVDKAGQYELTLATVDMSSVEGPVTIRVTRADNGAASVITFQNFDINGSWTGEVTFTDITGDPGAATNGGCDLADLQPLLNKPFPMTLQVTVDDKGAGTAVMVIDMSSLDQKGVKANLDPTTFTIHVTGSDIKFDDATVQKATASMSGTVAKQGEGLVMTGSIGLSGSGVGATGTWTLTGP